MAITLDQAKAHLNVTTDLDDQLIQGKLDAAKAWVGAYTASDDVDAAGTPAPVVEAVLMLTAQLYDNREISVTSLQAQELPFGFLDLLATYRAWSF